MENLLFSLQIVAPIFITMALGYLIKLTGIMTENTVLQVNKMIFLVLLPLLVFMNIYNSDSFTSLRLDLVIFIVAGTVIQFFIALSITLLSEKNNAQRGAILQGMFRSNYVLFAIPIALAIFGSDTAGVASLLIGIIIPLYNVLAVIALEMFNGGQPSFFKTIFGIIKNPLIIASVIAVLLKVFNIALPVLIHDTIGDISNITTPLAFLMLGSFFNFGDIGKYVKPLLMTTFFKLIVFPAIFILAAIFIGFRGGSLVIIMTVFASPIAVSSFTMAQEMGGDGKLAGQLVVFTSLLSVFTIFFIIFLLRTFAFI